MGSISTVAIITPKCQVLRQLLIKQLIAKLLLLANAKLGPVKMSRECS